MGTRSETVMTAWSAVMTTTAGTCASSARRQEWRSKRNRRAIQSIAGTSSAQEYQ